VALGADGPGLAAIALAAVAALAAIVAVSPIAVLAVTAAMAAAKVRFNVPPADQCPIQVLQSLFHVEYLSAACSVTARHAADVTVRIWERAAVADGTGVRRGAAVARSWIL
jgi:hypothetical protein